MAKTPDSFTQHALDQLEPLGHVTARSMFGAWCLMLDGNMLAIVDGGRLYLKVNDETKPLFAQAGGAPFTYFHKSKNTNVEMSYRSVPDGDLDDRVALMKWAQLAADVARAKGAAKKSKGATKKADAAPKEAEAAPKAKKAAPKKTTKKGAPKKAAPKKAPKNAAPKNAAPKNAAPKNAAPKKAAPKAKKAAPKKAAPKKAAPKRAATKKKAKKKR